MKLLIHSIKPEEEEQFHSNQLLAQLQLFDNEKISDPSPSSSVDDSLVSSKENIFLPSFSFSY